MLSNANTLQSFSAIENGTRKRIVDTKEVKRNLFARKAKTLSVQFPVIKDVSIGKGKYFVKPLIAFQSGPSQPYCFPIHIYGIQPNLLDFL